MSDIQDLFERDPLNLTTEDIDKIIARYREANAQFQAGVKTAGATKKVAGEKTAKLDLKELGLE